MRKVVLFLGLFLFVGQVGFGQVPNFEKEKEIFINKVKAEAENIEKGVKALKYISDLKEVSKTETINHIENKILNKCSKNTIITIVNKNKKITKYHLDVYLKKISNNTINSFEKIKTIDFVMFKTDIILPNPYNKQEYYFEYGIVRSLNISKGKENYIEDITSKKGKVIINKEQMRGMGSLDEDSLKFKIVGITCIEE